MLTIKQITENTDAVLRGLEKKHFKNAKETIAQVLDFNDKRKANQTILDKNLAEANSLSKSIGQLMKEGKKEEAEAAKSRVAELKEVNKDLQANMDQAANDLQTLLYTIPNVPYDSVPEGVGADDNVVEKIGGMETELPKDALPHWELAKKYDLIDFDLGVKITGAGFPVYKGKGAGCGRGVPAFEANLLRGPTSPGGIVCCVPVCRCVPVPLWRIRAGGSSHVRLSRMNRLHGGNIVCMHSS